MSNSRRVLKIILSVLAGIILCILIGLAFLPTILSTPWGNEKVAQIINTRISGKIDFKKLDISWLGAQTIENAQLFDSDGQQIASLNLATAKVPLWDLLLNKDKLHGSYEISGLKAQIVQEDNGQINIRHALAAKGEAKVSTSKQSPIAILLSDVNASAILGDAKNNHIQLSGKTLQGNIEGSFNLNISLVDFNKDKIFADRHRLNTDQLGKIQLQANVHNFPVSLLDEIISLSAPRLRGLLLTALGDKIDLNIQEFKVNDGIELKLNINSPFVRGTLNGLLKDDRVVVSKPDSLEMNLQPKLIAQLNQIIFDDQKFLLKNAAKAYLNLSKMNLIFDLENEKHSFIDLANSTILASLAVDQAEMQTPSPIGDISLQKLAITLDASDNNLANFSGKIIPSSNNTALYHLLGGETSLQLNIGLGLDQRGIKIGDFKAEVKSETAQAKIAGRLENFEKLFLTSPAIIHYNFSPAAIQLLGLNNLKLDENSKIQIHVDADKKGISFSDLSALQLKGLIKIDQINLYGNAGALQQVNMPWEISAPNNRITFQAKGITKLNSGKIEGSLEGLLQISHWFNRNEIALSQANIDAQLKLVNFPVGFVEKISGQEDLIALLGQAINIDIDAHFAKLDNLAGSIQLSIMSNDLFGQGSFNIEQGLIVNQPKTPTTIKLKLTPDQFQAFRKRMLNQGRNYPDIILTQPSQITLNINSLSMPLKKEDTPLWLKANISSNLTIDSLGIRDRKNGRQVWFQDIQGTLDSPELAKNISFSLNGRHNQEKGSPLPFSINGRAENTFTPGGKLNSDNLALLLETKFEKFPVTLLGQFLGMGEGIPQRISAVLGDAINADVHVQIDHLQGPVIANLSGSNGHVSLDAKINKGILTLNKNFRTQIALTQEFGKAVLEDIFPLASGLIGSDNPLIINVEAAGFALPIKNFDIKSVQIGSASLELGKVRFRSDGQLGTVLSLFNTAGNDQISVWFTPLYIKMQNGAIVFKRMDMLIMDAYHIATWGTVDLAADKVNMIIGLTGQALKKGFNIPEMSKDYVLQIPFKGTINNASIDKKKAVAKIAALVASNRGPEGLLIGTALNIASGSLSEEKAPPPTTNPLPWSTGNETSKSETSQSDTSHPLHQVEDKATSLLRNLIPF